MAGTNDQTLFKLIGEDTASGNIDSAYWAPKQHNRREGIFQVDISVAATVTLKGRKSSEFDWITLDTFTASGAKAVALMPHMSVTWSGNTGLVNAGLVD